MANHVAEVRATLKTNSFVSALNKLEHAAGTMGKRAGAQIGAGLKSGIGAARKTMSDMWSGLKTGLKTAATLGGALSIGKLVNDAMGLEHTYRNIAFQVNKTGKAAMSWQDAQKMIEPIAKKTGQSSADLAEAFQKVFGATGDLKFSKASLDAIGTAATATGQDVGVLANAAQLLQRKWGIAAEELPDALTRMVEKADVGGASLEDMGNKFALMAGEANEAGFKGKEGLSQLLGTMVRLDSRVGEKLSPGLKMMFQVLKNGSADIKTLQKESGIKFKADTTAFDKIKELLSSTKGRKAIEAKLTGESRTVFDELVKPFDEAFSEAKGKGAKTKEATAAGLAAFDKAMSDAGQSSLKFKKLQDEAAERKAKDPKVIIAQALEEVAQAFRDPEMMTAIHDLAESLPKLAKGAAKFVKLVTEHPMLAGGAAVGLKLGGAFMSGGGASMFAGVGKKIAAEFATSSAGIGREIAAQAAGMSAWQKAGAAIGIAAAAYVGFEIGKALSKKSIEKDLDAASKTQAGLVGKTAAGAGALTSKSVETREKALRELEAQIAATKKSTDVSRTSFSLGDAVSMAFGAPGLLIKRQAEKNLATGRGELGSAEETAAALRKSLDGTGKSGDDASKSLRELAQATSGAAKVLRDLKPPGAPPSGGGPVPVPTVPGNAPRPG